MSQRLNYKSGAKTEDGVRERTNAYVTDTLAPYPKLALTVEIRARQGKSKFIEASVLVRT